MSSLFNDPVYKEMKEDEDQWLNLAMESFELSVLERINELPEEVNISAEQIANFIHKRYNGRSVISQYSNSVSLSSDDLCKTFGMAIETKSSIEARFVRKLIETTSGGMFVVTINGDTIDFENNVYPTAKIVRQELEIDDEQILAMLASTAASLLWNVSTRGSNSITSRINEVIELISCNTDKYKEARKSRSPGRKLRYVANRVEHIIKENEWNIKSGDLMLEVIDWLYRYITHGHIPSLSNFSRLKCMTHKGEPIYSMEKINV